MFEDTKMQFKNVAKWVIRKTKPVSMRILRAETFLAKKWASSAYRKYFRLTWIYTEEVPEYFDHYIDLYYKWSQTRDANWLERGVFNRQALKMFTSSRALELCCGDGFNAKYFYSASVDKIICCDYNPETIAFAKRHNLCENIKYAVTDLRYEMPDGKFTNIIWDAAISYFSWEEIHVILGRIRQRLEPNGILSGSTIICKTREIVPQHKHEFADAKEIENLLKEYFGKVYIFESEGVNRHNVYFFASDGKIPFVQNIE